ncbi:MAG: xanthine dehydrogenase family protein subunit M [Betaproteobacteria bacterium]|nr:xanthine dehydrogenase family protein subunit M [Betaproteobacteria bacterium]
MDLRLRRHDGSDHRSAAGARVKAASFRYKRPASLADALCLLGEGGPDARAIAGGQSLVPAMNFRLARPALLVDLGSIAALRGIRVADDGSLVAGAMTRHSDFEFNESVRERLPLLYAAMPGIAHMPIRNRGTIGGSLAHADPAGDWPALCVACGAELVLKKGGSERIVPAENFSRGFFSTALAEGELISEIRFPAWPKGRRWGLTKMNKRRGDFALAAVACIVDLDGAKVSAARIVVYGATDAPLLLADAGDHLVGHVPATEKVEAAAIAAARTPVRSNLHASAEYRRELVRVLTRRALEQALPEARTTHD